MIGQKTPEERENHGKLDFEVETADNSEAKQVGPQRLRSD